MKVKDLYDHIVKHMTPEEALIQLLGSSTVNYEKLKFDSKGESVHPLIVISMATFDLGWNIAIQKEEGQVKGLIVGTDEYIQNILNPVKK